MRVFFQIAFFVMGVVQLFAAWDGLMYMLGVGSIVGGLLAVLLAYIPLVGSVVGIYGAMNVWHWPFLQSFVLFFWYVILWIAVIAFQNLRAVRAR